jgi:hypothetical protein
MNSSTLRTIIAVVLFIHAIGHVQGVLVSLGIFGSENWNAQSWLLDGILGEKGSRMLALVLWVVTVLGFLATAFAFLGIGVPHGWWRTLAITFAVISTIALIFYWNSFASLFPNKIGSLAVNLAILAGLLLMNWPAESDLGF